MTRFKSKRAWGPSRYSYGSGLRLRLDLPADGGLPTEPQTLWVGRGAQALRLDVSVVDRSEAPWGNKPLSDDEPPATPEEAR